MNRRQLFRNLFGAALAPLVPKILKDITPVSVAPISASNSLVGDLALLSNDFYPDIIRKYGNVDYRLVLETLSKNDCTESTDTFHHYKHELKTN